MNHSRSTMSSVLDVKSMEGLSQDNITLRRLSRNKVGMAATETRDTRAAYDNSLIEDILSQDEAKDVITMLDMADELGGLYTLPSFITSTQFNARDPQRKPISPQLSPITARARVTHDLTDALTDCAPTPIKYSRGDCSPQSGIDGLDYISREIYGLLSAEGASLGSGGSIGSADMDPRPGALELPDPISPEVVDPVVDPTVGCASDPLTQPGHDARRKTKTITEGVKVGPAVKDGGDVRLFGEGLSDVGEAGSLSEQDVDEESVTSEVTIPTDGDEADDERRVAEMADPEIVARKMKLMEGMLELLDDKSTRLEDTVKSLEDSLEFSYKEIADLKKENGDLRLLMGNLEMEDRRTQFQVKDVNEKLDRLDSVSKKKNLLFEGIPESTGKREDVIKIIWNIFDQLNVDKGVNFDACYRFGPESKSKPRPILVAFESQADRDMIYSRRMGLKHSEEFSRVWVNEDISPASKRKRDLIRHISKEAEQQGIDCRTGKYAIHINSKKYDENNLDELPLPLQPISLKQAKIDANTLAYQSEYAPLSNFFPCQIIVGKHKFFCAEQAFQFLRAKSLNRPLIATRIYLSRDARYIKQLGREMGTSDEWGAQQFDYMYICLKKKFEQNPELKAILLGTGDMELVEATPDRLWGCGATLSSNVLRRHTWTGQNKHGQILMTIREELRTTPM